jgi:F0F1-type ATP synthase membrane subunit b/b'
MPERIANADAAAGSAMQRAVVAERDAREAIATAEQQAALDIDRARTRARAILDQVPARIERLRQRGARAVAHAVAQIQAEEAAALAALGAKAFPEDLLGPTTAAIAARLAGGEEPPPS